MAEINTTGSSGPRGPPKMASNNTSPVRYTTNPSRTSTIREGDVRRGKKIGHRRVTEEGTVTYKKKPTSEIQRALQLGIQHHIGSIQKQAVRDVLYRDFQTIETVQFPASGTKSTPAHSLSDFRFRTYAPIAFRNFRTRYKLDIRDFLNSICNHELRELSNPGASGSIFYITQDDEFIIKTVQHREGEFLRALLPSYFMNLMQHPPTLLPKFHGFYCYQTSRKNIRFVVMNNLLPSSVKIHEKYDLKGSTHNRRASEKELAKSSPTLKDLDFRERNPHGIWLEAETYDALIKTIEQDCLVLESLEIMDYSLLLGIHNLDKAKRERAEREFSTPYARCPSDLPATAASGGDEFQPSSNHITHSNSDINGIHSSASHSRFTGSPHVRIISAGSPIVDQHERDYRYLANQGADGESVLSSRHSPTAHREAQTSRNSHFQRAASRLRSGKRLAAYCTAMESIEASAKPVELDKEELDLIPSGGIPARNSSGDRLLLFVGVIDILQSYRLIKKLEHGFKTLAIDGESVSVAPPNFYSQRFQDFLSHVVFKRIQSPMKQSSSKKNLLSTRQFGTTRPADDIQTQHHVRTRPALSSLSLTRTSDIQTPESIKHAVSSHSLLLPSGIRHRLSPINLQRHTEAMAKVVRSQPSIISTRSVFVSSGTRMVCGDDGTTESGTIRRHASSNQFTEYADSLCGYSPLPFEVDRRKFDFQLINVQRRARSTMFLNQLQSEKMLPMRLLSEMTPDFGLTPSPFHANSSTTSGSDINHFSVQSESWTSDVSRREASEHSLATSSASRNVCIIKPYSAQHSVASLTTPTIFVSDTTNSGTILYPRDVSQAQMYRHSKPRGRVLELRNESSLTKSTPVLAPIRQENSLSSKSGRPTSGIQTSSTMALLSNTSKMSEANSLEYFMHDAVLRFLDKDYDPYGLARKNLAGSLSGSPSYMHANTFSMCSPSSSGQYSVASTRSLSSPRTCDRRRRYRQTPVRTLLPPS